MLCPKCAGFMERRTHGRNISVERCGQCYGLFCQPEMLAEMKAAWMSEMLDSGDPRIGKKFNAVEDINCPHCRVPMTKRHDPKQSHIHFEQCPQCGGIFFDAGEFSDWKYETFLDSFRDFLA